MIPTTPPIKEYHPNGRFPEGWFFLLCFIFIVVIFLIDKYYG